MLKRLLTYFIFTCCTLAYAQYPDKPIKIIVPFPAGDGLDIQARMIGQKLSETLGQQVLIDNKPGAGTLIGVEAAGHGLNSGLHSAALCVGKPGVLHGNRTYLLQDENGQISETHSVSAGMDYPGVGPEHAWLKDSGRADYVAITDEEALKAFHDCCQIEGIIPALESAHAIAYACKLAATLPKDKTILVNLSGRGDKDMHTVAQATGSEG
jgi:tryptophan synthase beta subunit